MSDLQCAARFVLISDAESIAELDDTHIAAVYDAREAGHLEPPARLLELPVREVPRLVLRDVLDESPRELGKLRDLADLHRGETVVVLVEGEVGDRVDVSLDGDGVVLRRVSPAVGT